MAEKCHRSICSLFPIFLFHLASRSLIYLAQNYGKICFFGQNLFHIIYNYNLRSNVHRKIADRKGGVNPFRQPDRIFPVWTEQLNVSLLLYYTDFPKFVVADKKDEKVALI